MWKLLIAILLLSSNVAFGQSPHDHCRTIKSSQSETLLDSLTVIPGSIRFPHREQPKFTYNPNTGYIRFTEEGTTYDTVCYQTIPYSLHRSYERKSLAEYNEQQLLKTTEITPKKNILDNKEELFPTENLQKSGSLSRGISFGNTQNVVVNSALNLQMEGKLSDDLSIRASITDQNVPFQPEGNTAQIQDFDNISIELFNDNFSVRGGDVVFRNKESEFLRYYKNVQGGLASFQYRMGDKTTAQTSLGISIAKGKFASLQLEVEEGVAGPYRIIIPDASDFVIIMANSERVFLDGKQLQRGFNFDYIIDYNKAEIQFTSNVLITKFSRVRIDVEYSDRNYSRSIIAASHYQKTGAIGLSFNYYSERDNPNNPLTVPLDDEDRELMESIGDNLDLAVKVSGQETPFNPDEVLYELVDTTDLELRPFRVYKYSQNSEAVLYRVSFSNVGAGNGSYVLTNSTTNGRIYEWVSPVDGRQQGSHAPITPIPAPTRKDMITIGAEVDLSKHERAFTELAFSKNDLNRFSKLDSHDDNGFAIKGGMQSRRRPISFLPKYFFSANTDYEFDSKYFNAIDRFRYIEFNRDWNYDPTVAQDQNTEHIVNIGFELEKDALNRFAYKMVQRKRKSFVDGFQHYLNCAQQLGRVQLNGNAFLLNNQSAEFDANWQQLELEGYYKTRFIVPGYRYTIDENAIRSLGSDSITSTAMHYRAHTFYINSNDTLKTQFGLSYTIREDKSPIGGELRRGDASKTLQLSARTGAIRNQNLHFLLTYRNNTNYLLDTGPEDEETLITRADWYAGFFKRHVRSNLTYAIGNGRELRREFVYVQMPTGEGTHTWRDDNNDGIQDLSEFYLAVNPDEKKFVKVFVPTRGFVFAYETKFNYRLSLEMPRQWRSEKGIKKLLSKFSALGSWNIVKRITNPDLAARILPFYNKIPEQDILSLKEIVRTRLFFNRAHPGFGLDAGYLRSSNKQLLSQGFEQRSREEYSTNTRMNLSKLYSLKALYSWGSIASSSDFLQGRKYLIEQQGISGELSWQPANSFRLSMVYGYSTKRNRQGEPMETAEIHEISGNARISKATNFSLDAMLRYNNITYADDPNTPVAYEMLEALQPGQNISWSLMLQKKILQGLQLSMNYEGRASANQDVVHIGRMQVSALF
jgi:hypothetical protein